MQRKRHGFTVVELLIVIAVIAILVTIGIVAYIGVQKNASSAVVKSTAGDATSVLEVYNARNHRYPSNLADTNFTGTPSVALALYTNAAQVPVYQNLSAGENAQLFINSCNGFMPVMSGGTTYNTSCSYAGKNLHISGQSGSNLLLHGPTINESDFALTCGGACAAAQNDIKAAFIAQGGTFPITVSSGSSTLPAPQLITTGSATRYCLESRSPDYYDVIFHTTSDNTKLVEGACPDDPELHYP